MKFRFSAMLKWLSSSSPTKGNTFSTPLMTAWKEYLNVMKDIPIAQGNLVQLMLKHSMEQILERYERYSYSSRELVAIDAEAQENLSLECYKLKSKVEVLQRCQRHSMGEDIEALCIRELNNLEQQLETSLRKIRRRKNQLSTANIRDLQRKEKALEDENKKLRKKVKEKELTLSLCEQHIQMEELPSAPPLETLPSLNVSGPSQSSGPGGGQEEGARVGAPTPKAQIPPWMLGHINQTGMDTMERL